MEELKRTPNGEVITMEQSTKVNALFNAMYPSFQGYLTYDKEFEVAKFIQLGFTPYFSFYGENGQLHPQISWYGFYGKRKEEILNLVICVNSIKEEYTVYKNKKKIGTFNDLDDILELFNVKQYTPELSTFFTDFLLFEKDKLGEILKKAKSLMDNEEWNQMVEKAARLNKEEPYSPITLEQCLKVNNNKLPKIIVESFEKNANINKKEAISEPLEEKMSKDTIE